MHTLTTAPTLPQLTIALNGEHFLSARPPAIYRYYQQSFLSIFPTGGPVEGGTLITVRGYGLVKEPTLFAPGVSDFSLALNTHHYLRPLSGSGFTYVA
jgi:hypothetical protein